MPATRITLKWADGRVTWPYVENDDLLKPRLPHPDYKGKMHDFVPKNEEMDGCEVYQEVEPPKKIG
jgi:hypothetical protein